MSFKGSPKQLRRLLAHVQRLEDEKKIKLARQIHDDVSQKLTALSIELSLLHKRLAGNEPAPKIAEILELAGTINRSVRNITNDVHSTLLDQFGVVPALRQECQKLAVLHGRPVSFEIEGEELNPSRAAQVELFGLLRALLVQLLECGRTGLAVRVYKWRRHLVFEFSQKAPPAQGRRKEASKLEWLMIEERAHRLGAKLQFSKSDGLTVIKLVARL